MKTIKTKQWETSNQDNAQYLGVLEFKSNDEEYHVFHVLDIWQYV